MAEKKSYPYTVIQVSDTKIVTGGRSVVDGFKIRFMDDTTGNEHGIEVEVSTKSQIEKAIQDRLALIHSIF